VKQGKKDRRIGASRPTAGGERNAKKKKAFKRGTGRGKKKTPCAIKGSVAPRERVDLGKKRGQKTRSGWHEREKGLKPA